MSYSVLRIFFRGDKINTEPQTVHCKTQQDELAKRDELMTKDNFERCEVHRHTFDVVIEKAMREVPYTQPIPPTVPVKPPPTLPADDPLVRAV